MKKVTLLFKSDGDADDFIHFAKRREALGTPYYDLRVAVAVGKATLAKK